MAHQLQRFSVGLLANPHYLRLALWVIVLLLLAMTLLVPSMSILAGEIPGGPHPCNC
jgi:hypothetical protein